MKILSFCSHLFLSKSKWRFTYCVRIREKIRHHAGRRIIGVKRNRRYFGDYSI